MATRYDPPRLATQAEQHALMRDLRSAIEAVIASHRGSLAEYDEAFGTDYISEKVRGVLKVSLYMLPRKDNEAGPAGTPPAVVVRGGGGQ